MKPDGARAVLAIASLAAALAFYVSVGHGLHEAMEGMSTHGLGVCMVILAAGVVAVATAAVVASPVFAAPRAVLGPAAVVLAAPLDARARASPAYLQRFLA
jgi:hypothetical protein